MALRFRHINAQQTLNTVKFSADSTNTTYFLHSSTSTQLQGTPDVNYEDICFIKPTGQLYTHGKLYNGENNSKYTDGYLDYLHKLCTENNKNAIILSGGEKYENGIRNAFVYIDNVGIKSVNNAYSGSFTINTDYKIILYTISSAYFFVPSTYNLKDTDELVCDWADLARLSDLEVPMATEYQNGLMSVEDKMNFDMRNLFYRNDNKVIDSCMKDIVIPDIWSKLRSLGLTRVGILSGEVSSSDGNYFFLGSGYINASGNPSFCKFYIYSYTDTSAKFNVCGYNLGTWFYNSN